MRSKSRQRNRCSSNKVCQTDQFDSRLSYQNIYQPVTDLLQVEPTSHLLEPIDSTDFLARKLPLHQTYSSYMSLLSLISMLEPTLLCLESFQRALHDVQ